MHRPAAEAAPSRAACFDRDRAVWLSTHILPHETALRRWLSRRCRTPSDVDDLVQESYALIAGLKSVDHIGHPKSYFFQTARSLILRQARRAKVVSILAVDNLDLAGVCEDPSPERQVAARQELRLLTQALEALPSLRREAFRLRKIEGVSQKEIALRLGLSEKAVEKHVAKAVGVLINLYGGGGKRAAGASIVANIRCRFARDQTRD